MPDNSFDGVNPNDLASKLAALLHVDVKTPEQVRGGTRSRQLPPSLYAPQLARQSAAPRASLPLSACFHCLLCRSSSCRRHCRRLTVSGVAVCHGNRSAAAAESRPRNTTTVKWATMRWPQTCSTSALLKTSSQRECSPRGCAWVVGSAICSGTSGHEQARAALWLSRVISQLSKPVPGGTHHPMQAETKDNRPPCHG